MNDSKDSSSSLDKASDGRVQINQNIPYRSVVATGFSIAIGVGIMLAIGRLVTIYDTKFTLLGFLLLILFVVPFLLTYSERVEAISSEGGLYGLARERLGLMMSFLIGWLEIAGYATVIVILARVIGGYSISIYHALGGDLTVNLPLVAVGAVVLMIFFIISGIHGSRKLNTLLAFAGLAFMVAIAIVSAIHSDQTIKNLPTVVKSMEPFKLTALLLSGFWGVIMIFNLRRRMVVSGKKSIARASSTIMLIFIVLGVLLTLAIAPNAKIDSQANVLIMDNQSMIAYSGAPIYTVLIGLFAILISLMGLSRSLKGSAEIMSQITEDGFFPPAFNHRVNKAVFPPLLIVAILAAILIFFLDTKMVVGMASAFLLWATIVIHAPDIVHSAPKLPKARPIHLPYHPLFPALTVVMATIATLNLPLDALEGAGLWFGVGIVLLVVYSYKRALKVRARERTIAEEVGLPPESKTTKKGKKEGPPVLAFVQDLDYLSNMIRMGVPLAKRLQASLVVMLLVEVSDELPDEERRQQGSQEWDRLAAKMKEIKLPEEGISVRPTVRVTHDLAKGAINAMEELHPLQILVPPGFISDDPAQNLEDYDAILRKAPGDVIFFNSFPPGDELNHIAVFVDQGVQTQATLVLAQTLLAKDGVIELFHALLPGIGENEAEARERILTTLKKQGFDVDRMQLTFQKASSLEDAVRQVAEKVDLILLGANKNFMTRQPTFGGFNAHIFQNVSAPIMLVGRHESLRFSWFSSLWVTLTKPLPKITLKDREDAAKSILAGADANIDFFILIILSAGIATYGLLQNSGAVIIGAMLVAPLMSPIVAIAMSMVRGKQKTLGIAAQSTAQGVLLAISVGAVLTFFSPIKSPTNEIMSRVSPNLLDLSIAFLSGAAGAYAMSRKSIASALPGVSIAVALVPPLAVVGYGFATADLNIAFGALLLFLTNLVAIVFAASLVFIALDFLTTEKQTWGEIVKGLRLSLAFVVIVLLILGWVTFKTVNEQHKLRAINQVLNQSVYSQNFKPLKIDVKKAQKGYTIKATLLGYDKPLTSDQVEQLNQKLEKAVGGPVSLDITVVPAQEGTVNFKTAVTTTKIEEAIQKEIKDLSAEVLNIKVEPAAEGYEATVTVVEYQPGAISQQTVNEMEKSLSQQFDTTISIQLYAIPVQKMEGEVGKTPMPALTATPTQ